MLQRRTLVATFAVAVTLIAVIGVAVLRAPPAASEAALTEKVEESSVSD